MLTERAKKDRKPRAKEVAPRGKYKNSNGDTLSQLHNIMNVLPQVGDSIIIETTENQLRIIRNSLFQYDRRAEEHKDIKVSCTKIVGVIVSNSNVGGTLILLKITRTA